MLRRQKIGMGMHGMAWVDSDVKTKYNKIVSACFGITVFLEQSLAEEGLKNPGKTKRSTIMARECLQC